MYLYAGTGITSKRFVEGGVWNGDDYVSGGSSLRVEIKTALDDRYVALGLVRIQSNDPANNFAYREVEDWRRAYARDWWANCL